MIAASAASLHQHPFACALSAMPALRVASLAARMYGHGVGSRSLSCKLYHNYNRREIHCRLARFRRYACTARCQSRCAHVRAYGVGSRSISIKPYHNYGRFPWDTILDDDPSRSHPTFCMHTMS
eukprot:6214665-Pleurochrysis_carterae.AAC.3